MSRIDFTQIITAEAKSAEDALRQQDQRKARCREKILAVVDETAQINLAAAAAAGALDAAQMAAYRQGLAWIHAMRAACADGNWPEAPADVVSLASAF